MYPILLYLQETKLSMSKRHLLFVLLSVWIFAIVAPPIISLLCEDGKSIITVNLNEEEQQEQGKKSIDEKLVVKGNSSDFSFLYRLQYSTLYDFYLLGKSDYASEIFLPPPEHHI